MKVWAVYKQSNKTPFAMFRTEFEAGAFVDGIKGYDDTPMTIRQEDWRKAGQAVADG